MKNILLTIIVIIIWTALTITGTVFYLNYFGEKPPPEIVYRETTVDIPIIRKYIKMTPAEKDTEILHYDTDLFKLDVEPYKLDKTNFRITGEVYKRKAYRDVKIECGGSGNFKFYIGVGIIAGAAVTYGAYKLINK